MNQKVKSEWVDALRSGYYRKGQSQLRDLDDYYDATGVLCDLAERAGIIGAPKRYDTKGGVFFGYRYGGPDQKDCHATGLPSAVCEWADLPYRVGYKVALMGDGGKSFNKLADWIEENL